MHHFYKKEFSLPWLDSYLACSKRACFCYSLHARYYPWQFDLRPSHGIAWPKWALADDRGGEDGQYVCQRP